MTPNHTDSPHVPDTQCTCNIGRWPGGPEWDPDCPLHGRDAPLPEAGAKPLSTPRRVGTIRGFADVYEDESGLYAVYDRDDYPQRIRAVECIICGKYDFAGDHVEVNEEAVCGRCADTIMNLRHHRMTGRYISWPNEAPANDTTTKRRPLTPGRRRAVYERDHYACRYCGARQQLVIDHVQPVSRGGTNELENLVTACSPCNQRKLDRTPEEAGMPLHAPEHFA